MSPVVTSVASSPVRTWVHSRLTTYSPLVAITSDRVWQQGAILTAQEARPYLVHHFGNNTDEGMYDEDSFQPNRQFLQVFIHTDQGDYGPIDDIVPLVKEALLVLAGKPAELIGVQYLETSQDLQDDTLQTYFRYMRFQLILAR
jgi:hypothetical protein